MIVLTMVTSTGGAKSTSRRSSPRTDDLQITSNLEAIWNLGWPNFQVQFGHDRQQERLSPRWMRRLGAVGGFCRGGGYVRVHARASARPNQGWVRKTSNCSNSTAVVWFFPPSRIPVWFKLEEIVSPLDTESGYRYYYYHEGSSDSLKSLSSHVMKVQ